MNGLYQTLYKEYLGPKGEPEAGAERAFVGPFRSNPDAENALRTETLMALQSNKNAVCFHHDHLARRMRNRR